MSAMIQYDDKRLLPEFGKKFWCERLSEREWGYCKYCYHDVPTFVLAEGEIGSGNPLQLLRCCWECGAGIEILENKPENFLALRRDS